MDFGGTLTFDLCYCLVRVTYWDWLACIVLSPTTSIKGGEDLGHHLVHSAFLVLQITKKKSYVYCFGTTILRKGSSVVKGTEASALVYLVC